MVAGDDFVIGPRPLDLTLPPLESFGGHRASRRSATTGLAADRVRQVITITHHQHTDVAELEGVTFPGAVDRIGTLGIVHEGCLGMLTERIGPFAEPPVRLLALARWDAVGRCVMIARNIINLLTSMLLQNGVLPNDLSTLFILGRVPEARIVTEVERNVPRDGRPADGTAFLRLAQCFCHRFRADWRRSESDHAMLSRFAHCLVGADMRVGDDPKIEDCCLFVSGSNRRLGSGAERRRHQRQRPGRQKITSSYQLWDVHSNPPSCSLQCFWLSIVRPLSLHRTLPVRLKSFWLSLVF